MLPTRCKLHTCRVLLTSWDTPALARTPAMGASHAKRSPPAVSSPFGTLATSARFLSYVRCARSGADHDREDFYVLFHTKTLRDHENVGAARHSGAMGYDIPASADEIARWQAGAISRRQLLAAGVSNQIIFERLKRRRWQQLFRGVYAVFSGLPPRETWLWAAILSAGEGAVLSHQTAAELHGLLDPPADAIYVTVPSTRRVATRGLIIRTSGRVKQARQPNRAPPRTSVEETVLDLVQLAPGSTTPVAG